MTRPIFACVLLPVAILLASGCRSAETESASDQSHLRLVMRSAPLSLDPHLRNEIVTNAVLGNVFEGLVGYDLDGRLVPVLAERWENPDDQTWRIVMREGVSFHDGSPFSADDAAFSIERARSHPSSNFRSLLVQVQEIRRVDDRTIEITTRRPYPPLLSKLAFVLVVPQGSPEEIVAPIGTGPWQLVDHRDQSRLELERSPNYWGPRPAFARTTILAEPDPARRVEMLLAGEVDVAQTIPASELEKVAAHGCCRIVERDGLQLEYLALDPRKPPFDDLRVRQAVDLAIDREALVAGALGGHGQALGQLAPVNVFGHDPSLGPAPADPDRARQLLAEAGFGDGLEIVIETRDGREVDELVAQLEVAGFRASAALLPWPEMLARRNAELVAAYFGGIVAVSADASDVLDSLAHSRDLERGYGAHNLTGYANPEVDRPIEAASRAKDLLERRELLGQALRRVREDAVYLALYSRHEVQGTRRGLTLDARLDGCLRAVDVRPEPRSE